MYLTYLVQENKHRELGKMRRQGNMLQMKKQAKPQKKNESTNEETRQNLRKRTKVETAT